MGHHGSFQFQMAFGEYVNIKTAYSQFSDWVTSGGTENEKWWNDFDVNKVFQTNKN